MQSTHPQSDRDRPRLPPGPTWMLPNVVRYLRDPVAATMTAFARWGDPHTVRAFGVNIVATANPDLVRAIVTADPDSYDPFAAERLAPVLGRNSVMLLGGDEHRAARKLQSAPFHGPRMRAYAQLMRTLARAEATTWPTQTPFSLQPAMQAISLRVILRAVLGAGAEDEAAVAERLFVDLTGALDSSTILLGALQTRAFPLWRRFLRRRQTAERWILDEAARRRGDHAQRDDVLSLLLAARYDDGSALSDAQIVDAMITLLVAGHETTAIALTWALWLLHRHPPVLARLREEIGVIDAPEQLATLPYLEAVCHETLRLRPVAASIVRLLKRPMQLGDWRLPAGTALNASLIGLHRRPELFADPMAFRPERFLGHTFAPCEYMPFGGGARRCLGATFAMFEMKIVLATILQTRRLHLGDTADIGLRPRNTVLGPARAVRFVAD